MLGYRYFIIDLLVAAACGAFLGLDREMHRKPAGLRTNMLIALGAALFTYASQALFSEFGQRGDPARIAAQIVVGIGFIGAGAIMRHNDQVTGLTSAATVWVVAAIGLLAGAGHPLLAVTGTAIAMAILHLMMRIEGVILARLVQCRARIFSRDREGILTELEALFRASGVSVQSTNHKTLGEDRVEITMNYYTTRTKHERVKKKLVEIDGIERIEARVL